MACELIYGGTPTQQYRDAAICLEPELVCCEHCGEGRCAKHMKICAECKGVFCYAGRYELVCYDQHDCKLAKQVTETYQGVK